MYAAHTPVYVNYSGGDGNFANFLPARVTHCTDWVKLTFPRQISPPTRIYDAHITLVTTCYDVCVQSNEVESSYLQEKVTSLQVQSSVWTSTL